MVIDLKQIRVESSNLVPNPYMIAVPLSSYRKTLGNNFIGSPGKQIPLYK